MTDRYANSDPRSTAFGRYLKAMRTQMGISLHAVARHLHVGEDVLCRIEAEDHARLPAPVEVKGLLRAYARCIGVDADDVVERYILNRTVYRETRSKGKKQRRFGGKMGMRMGIPAGFLILIVFLVYMVYEFFLISFPFAGEKKPAPVDRAAPPLTGEVRMAEEFSDGEPMLLRIDAVEDTRLRIIVDEDPPLEYALHPMDHMEMAALAKIELRIGNPRGVKVFLNEKPVTIAGETGQAVDVILSRAL